MIKPINPVRVAMVALIAGGAAPAAPALASPAAPYVPRELVVKYRDGTAGAERDDVRRDAGVRSAGLISGTSQRVEITDSDTTLEAAAELEADPRVEYALPNYTARVSGFVPNDPGRGGAGNWASIQWNFVGPFGIRVLGAWDNAIASGAPGGKGVVVAVLDTGVAYRRSRSGRYRVAPDLDRKRFVRGRDFVKGNAHPYDRNGHGTFVAGTIAQKTNNGFGVTGIAYRSRIMPVRVLDAQGRGDVATIARGIRFAARRGADVINMSFEFSIGLTETEIPDVIRALRFARRKGVLLIAAAGNAESHRIAYPARAKNVVAVGATTEHGCLAEYSNTGTGLDIVAPGGGADAFIPGDANCRPAGPPGRDVFQHTFVGASKRRFGLPSGYEGTSMAVPHVVGTAALMMASGMLGPDPDPATVAGRLQSTARDLGRPGYDTTYGWGLLDAAAATTP